jgi:hypothetical protein
MPGLLWLASHVMRVTGRQGFQGLYVHLCCCVCCRLTVVAWRLQFVWGGFKVALLGASLEESGRQGSVCWELACSW